MDYHLWNALHTDFLYYPTSLKKVSGTHRKWLEKDFEEGNMMIKVHCLNCKETTTYDEDLTYLFESKIPVDPMMKIFKCIGCAHRICVDCRIIMIEAKNGNLFPFIEQKHVVDIS